MEFGVGSLGSFTVGEVPRVSGVRGVGEVGCSMFEVRGWIVDWWLIELIKLIRRGRLPFERLRCSRGIEPNPWDKRERS